MADRIDVMYYLTSSSILISESLMPGIYSSLSSSSVIKDHNQPVKASLKCPLCFKEFSTIRKLKRHERIHTDEKRHECSICKKKFSHLSGLKTHEKIHTNEKPFKCTICNKQFSEKGNLKKHMLIHTGEKPFDCRTCGKLFRHNGNRLRHEKNHTVAVHENIMVDGELYQNDNTALNAAMNDIANDSQYGCMTCGKFFDDGTELQNHMQIHLRNQPGVASKYCLQLNPNNSMENKGHVQVSSELFEDLQSDKKFGKIHCLKDNDVVGKRFKCTICDKQFRLRTVLKNHMRIHTGEKPFECSICKKTFSQPAGLKNHKKVHTHEKPFQCSICNKQFSEKGNMRKHMIVHTNDKPFVCRNCGKQFRHNSNRLRHEKSHTNVTHQNSINVELKRYNNTVLNCITCGKCFIEPNALRNHMRIHTNEKSFECSICKKKFNQPTGLKNHEKIHTNKKPFNCLICNKQFSEKGNMKKHMMIHTGEKPFKCQICGKLFRFESNRLRHEKIHTGSESRDFKITKLGNPNYSLNSGTGHVYKHQNSTNAELCHNNNTAMDSMTFGKSTNYSNALHIHMHTNEKQFKCFTCGKQFSQPTGLKNHEKIHTNKKSFKCSICNKLFSEKGNMKKHMTIHTGEKPYKCQICSKLFRFDSNRLRHEKSHSVSGNRNFKINKLGDPNNFLNSSTGYVNETSLGGMTSDKLTSDKNDFLIQMQSHSSKHDILSFDCKQPIQIGHGENQMSTPPALQSFDCKHCSKTFQNLISLQNHMRIHTKEKAFKCTICGSQFQLRATLVNHMRKHTGEKPYKCVTCGKQFSQLSGLKNHKRIHTNEKPFNCTICNKQFSEKGNMKRHMIIHTNEKPYGCRTCGKPFRFDTNRLRHEKIHDHEEGTCHKISSELLSHGHNTKFNDMYSHANGSHYNCLICGQGFSDHNVFQEHVQINSCA